MESSSSPVEPPAVGPCRPPVESAVQHLEERVKTRRMSQQAGFSLVELVITLVIAGVLVAFAAPNMGIFLRNSARTTILNEMVAGIQFARSEAVKNNQRVMLCPVDVDDQANNGASPFNSAAPGGSCLTTGDYSTGWVVFLDDGTTAEALDDDDRVLRIFQAPNIGTGTFVGEDGGGNQVDTVAFLGTGLADDLETNSRFKYCDDRDPPISSARAVLLNASGQPRVVENSEFALTCP